MAGTVFSTGAPVCATPTIWTQDPRAVRLLVSCAKNPPKGSYIRSGFSLHREMDSQYTYSGYRAEALAAIREEYGRRALHHAWATDDYSPHDAWCDQPTVTAAIDAAGIALVYGEAAVDLRRTLMAIAVAPFQMAGVA